MDAATLVRAMPGCPLERAQQYVAGCNAALIVGNMTTVNRAAMFLAQCGEESGSMQWPEELGSGEEYNGRADLGNVLPGDGPRYQGRSFIQITGRNNYSHLSEWAHTKGLVPTATYFVDNPTALASAEHVWTGPVWYFSVARSDLDSLADNGNIVGASKAVNGGTNGLADRESRWQRCLALGAAILPTATPTPVPTPAPPTALQGDEIMAFTDEDKTWLKETIAATVHADNAAQAQVIVGRRGNAHYSATDCEAVYAGSAPTSLAGRAGSIATTIGALAAAIAKAVTK